MYVLITGLARVEGEGEVGAEQGRFFQYTECHSRIWEMPRHGYPVRRH